MEEQQRIEIIKNFKELREGELWIDMKRNFQKKKIELIEEDRELLLNKIEEMNGLLQHCVENQKYLNFQRTKKQEEDLNNFFEMIKSYKK